jgi:hypothetical protein
MSVGTYIPQNVDCVFANHPISGFADGTMINVVRTSERVVTKAGVKGDVAVAFIHDKRAVVTVSLLATSASNDVLSRAAEGKVIGAFLLKDHAGTTLVKSPYAVVKKDPDLGFSQEVPNRDWEIELLDATIFVGSTPALATT